MASISELHRYIAENASRMSPSEYEHLMREAEMMRRDEERMNYQRMAVRASRNPFRDEYPGYFAEPDTTNGIDKKKVFEGKPGSVAPVEVMKSLVRVSGEELKNRVAKFL